MLSPIAQQLLETSSDYVSARFAFDRAVSSARREGMSDEEIAHLTGFTVAMVEAVSGRRRAQPG